MTRKNKAIELLKKELESIEIDEVYITKEIYVSDIDSKNLDNNIVVDGEIEIFAHYEYDDFGFYQAGWVVNSASFSGYLSIIDEDCKTIYSEKLNIFNLL